MDLLEVSVLCDPIISLILTHLETTSLSDDEKSVPIEKRIKFLIKKYLLHKTFIPKFSAEGEIYS
jgi:hypothetical protein